MTDEAIRPSGSPLRLRMTEDMTVRGFTACTQRGYIAAVKIFTVFLGRSPDQATAEDLRRFQLHMRSEGASATTMNMAVSALRFFFGVTLGRGDAEVGMTTVSLHTLRHCFATHLLEQKVDIRVIQVLLGHKKLETTAHYSQVDSTTLKAVKSPQEYLTQGPLPPA